MRGAAHEGPPSLRSVGPTTQRRPCAVMGVLEVDGSPVELDRGGRLCSVVLSKVVFGVGARVAAGRAPPFFTASAPVRSVCGGCAPQDDSIVGSLRSDSTVLTPVVCIGLRSKLALPTHCRTVID